MDRILTECGGNTGTIVRTWTVRDDCNNTANCVQTITIVDETAPVIICAPATTVSCNEATTPENTGTPTATDNCSATTAMRMIMQEY